VAYAKIACGDQRALQPVQLHPVGHAAPSASSMIRRMVRAQRPHCGLQPRQPYTSPAVCGAPVLTAVRTSWSVRTLQEQTIMARQDELRCDGFDTSLWYHAQRKTQIEFILSCALQCIL
jgi:hypothetical protein